jgi:superfamily II DNA helicase RecQ
MPQTPDELIQINGIGEIKLARYGAAFLDLIKAAETSSVSP